MFRIRLITCCGSLSQVRETADHGPVNTWARVSYWTNASHASPTHTPRTNTIRRNLIIGGYSSVFALDHDDGSSFYLDSSNVLCYGGCKQHGGSNKSCGPDNLILARSPPPLSPDPSQLCSTCSSLPSLLVARKPDVNCRMRANCTRSARVNTAHFAFAVSTGL